ncbi:hypothetical protein [Sphingobacterium suaedae]|uniref:Uncharacterized protein n=1 Tax=Sphingobacterium suaedae TaxID=1686402 RepID=A0ABW5KHI5_9SPHI
MIPKDYLSWRQCIEQQCGIPLTSAFVASRLAIYRDPNLPETQRFRTRYGQGHVDAIIRWFEQAQRELADTSET